MGRSFNEAARALLGYMKPGDWLTVSLSVLFVAWLFTVAWTTNSAEKVVIRSSGKVFAELPLATKQTVSVPGPLGTTVIAVDRGRARVERDPSPRQYCVKQGWLARAGEVAVCLPNQVSVELAGKTRAYDSLNY
jgi:hypothetical protein